MHLIIKKILPATELIKNAWLIFAAFGGIIYWAAKHDSSLTDIAQNRAQTELLENKVITLENGLDKLQVKIDGIKEDLTLIKSAVLK